VKQVLNKKEGGKKMVKEKCWICGREVNRTYLSQFDPEQKYPLCWFCCNDLYRYFCKFGVTGEHDGCKFWDESLCTRKITEEEMYKVKELMHRDRAGGFRYVK
jgi:hypothetical protein